MGVPAPPGPQLYRSFLLLLKCPIRNARQKADKSFAKHEFGWGGSFAENSIYQTCQPPKRANLETLQKSPEKPGDWDLKPGDLQDMCKMKIKMVDFLFQGILYLICATYCILLPHFLKSISVLLSTRGASLS